MAHPIDEYLALKGEDDSSIIADILPRSGALSIFGSPKTGKALALDTPIPTPSGMRTMGEIQVGDWVFGANGQPTKVVAISDVQAGRPCFRVTFSSGESLVADAEHLWEVTSSGKQCPTCNPPRVYTTVQLLEKGIVSLSQYYTKAKWQIRLPEPLEFGETSSLPLDPYLLGLWLGDGTSVNGQFTTADPELVAAWQDAGWIIKKQPSNTYGYGIRGLKAKLESIGVLGNKHIPAAYFIARPSERLALLQGLLDTDGNAAASGAEFSNTDKDLAEGVLQLARELGFNAKLKEGRATLYGVDKGPKFRVTFRSHLPPFRLARKRLSWKANTERYWTIRAIEPVESVPVKCIVVENPDHLFLVGHSRLVTHNSYLSLQLANAIGCLGDAEFMGFPIRTHGEVLYLQIDTPRNIWIDRVAALRAKGLPFENVYFADRLDCPEVTFNVLNPAHEAWLISEAASRPFLTVIIDTLRETFDGDENDSNQMKMVVSKLVKATSPAALVLISHARKPAKDQPSGIMQNQRGSSYVAGRMDALLEVGKGKLTAQSRTLGETQVAIKQAEDSGLFTPDEPHLTIAQNLITDNPLLATKEQARLLQERIGGGKSLEACRSLIRRLKGGKS